MHIYVFDDSGRGGQQQGRHGRNSCCDRTDDGDAGPEGVHGANDSKRGDVIDAAAVSLQGIGKHALERTPIQVAIRVMAPITTVPIIIALCRALVFCN